MDKRLTTLERAYQLAESGECSTVQEIKLRLRKERLNDEQIMGPVLLADLRRLMRDGGARAGACASSGVPSASAKPLDLREP